MMQKGKKLAPYSIMAAGSGALVATHLPVLAGLPSTELSLGGGQTT